MNFPLCQEIQSYGRVAICLSAGMSSCVLAAIAQKILGPKNVLAVSVETPFMPQGARERCAQLAAHLGLQYVVINCDFLSMPYQMLQERTLRFYRYKAFIYSQLKDVAKVHSVTHLLDASHSEPLGLESYEAQDNERARREFHIISPFKNQGMNLDDIRQEGRIYGLDESFCRGAVDSCLLSRFACDIAITEKDLMDIRAVEASYQALGFVNCRLRMVAWNCLQLEVPKVELRAMCMLHPPFPIRVV
ncbi:MAG: hypothetical protein R3Y56_04425 [Akkermansia sp.]